MPRRRIVSMRVASLIRLSCATRSIDRRRLHTLVRLRYDDADLEK